MRKRICKNCKLTGGIILFLVILLKGTPPAIAGDSYYSPVTNPNNQQIESVFNEGKQLWSPGGNIIQQIPNKPKGGGPPSLGLEGIDDDEWLGAEIPIEDNGMLLLSLAIIYSIYLTGIRKSNEV